jgi:lipopolysaccharide biosynthesis glycosyltransferase
MYRSNVVALIANGPYIPGAFATAASILATGLREDASMVIVHPADALTTEQQSWIARRYPGIELLEVDAADFLPIQLSSWNTILRFALAEIFPSARKILYVDSDILALRSIDVVFDFDLGKKLIAAADDDLVAGLVGHKQSWIAYRKALGVPPEVPYLNCGVFLMDAVVWREGRIKQALIETFQNNQTRCRYFDQSAINLFLMGDFARLSPAWNFQQNYQAINAEDLVRPCLVHFAGSAKPWRNDGFVFSPEYRYRYRELLGSTPFAPFFEPFWRVSRKQAKEAWRAINRMLRGREVQSGIKRSEVGRIRAQLLGLLATGTFVDREFSRSGRSPEAPSRVAAEGTGQYRSE